MKINTDKWIHSAAGVQNSHLPAKRLQVDVSASVLQFSVCSLGVPFLTYFFFGLPVSSYSLKLFTTVCLCELTYNTIQHQLQKTTILMYKCNILRNKPINVTQAMHKINIHNVINLSIPASTHVSPSSSVPWKQVFDYIYFHPLGKVHPNLYLLVSFLDIKPACHFLIYLKKILLHLGEEQSQKNCDPFLNLAGLSDGR